MRDGRPAMRPGDGARAGDARHHLAGAGAQDRPRHPGRHLRRPAPQFLRRPADHGGVGRGLHHAELRAGAAAGAGVRRQPGLAAGERAGLSRAMRSCPSSPWVRRARPSWRASPARPCWKCWASPISAPPRPRAWNGARVVSHHALPNAAIPTVTIIGFMVGSLVAGAVVVESVFAWPGVGRLLVVGRGQPRPRGGAGDPDGDRGLDGDGQFHRRHRSMAGSIRACAARRRDTDHGRTRRAPRSAADLDLGHDRPPGRAPAVRRQPGHALAGADGGDRAGGRLPAALFHHRLRSQGAAGAAGAVRRHHRPSAGHRRARPRRASRG